MKRSAWFLSINYLVPEFWFLCQCGTCSYKPIVPQLSLREIITRDSFHNQPRNLTQFLQETGSPTIYERQYKIDNLVVPVH